MVALVAGCAADSSTTLRTLGSWAATGAMLGQAWADGATPREYTTRALDRAQRELVRQARELETLPAQLRVAATPLASHVARGLDDLRAAVHARDRARARTLAEALAVDARRLRELVPSSATPS